MPRCEECTYYSEDGEWYNRVCYCTLLVDKRGNFLRVDKNGSCNNFSPRITPTNSGYKGGSPSGCFLTSACVKYLGKADDCDELTALRSFRDGYMRKTAEGRALVKEYYEVAPKIVEAIDASPDSAKYYQYINEVVNRCVKLIDEKKYAETQQEYVNMVQKLKEILL